MEDHLYVFGGSKGISFRGFPNAMFGAFYARKIPGALVLQNIMVFVAMKKFCNEVARKAPKSEKEVKVENGIKKWDKTPFFLG